jgi:predicted DNA binding protein
MSPRPALSCSRSIKSEAPGFLRKASKKPDRTDSVEIVKLEFDLPPGIWYADLSRQHPELIIDIINLAYRDSEALGEFEIYGPSWDWTSEIGGFPDVIEVEPLEVRSDSARYRVRFRQSSLSKVWKRLDFLARFPRTIRNGHVTSEAIAWRSRLPSIQEALSKLGAEPRFVSFRPVPYREDPRSVPSASSGQKALMVTMTSVQHALFRKALAAGYFDVPRRITLTQLAKEVSRNKSSVSKTLHRVEWKLAEFAAASYV